MSSSEKHALVFGASGISGWSICRQALSYPTPSTYTTVTGLTNRPISLKDAGLPSDPRLALASGIDLTSSVPSVITALKSKVAHISSTTHVYFTAYIEKPDFQSAKEINTSILETAIKALDEICPNLETVILQTGGKGYGVEFSDKVTISPPLKESTPLIPKPYYDNVFYYTQYDLLASVSKDRKWTFSEIRPDVIVGFVPGTNFMNAAQGLGLYLSLYREVHGEGAKVPFPGTQKSWRCKHTDTFQDILAKMEIHVSLNRERCENGSSFNIADGNVITWEEKWPGLCKYFGLAGEGPRAEGYESAGKFAEKNKKTWDEAVKKHGLKTGRMENFSWGFLDFVMAKFDFDRQYDLRRAREVGFEEKIETVKGYCTSFDRMREAKVIPKY